MYIIVIIIVADLLVLYCTDEAQQAKAGLSVVAPHELMFVYLCGGLRRPE